MKVRSLIIKKKMDKEIKANLLLMISLTKETESGLEDLFYFF